MQINQKYMKTIFRVDSYQQQMELRMIDLYALSGMRYALRDQVCNKHPLQLPLELA